jgi:hypothetical protein
MTFEWLAPKLMVSGKQQTRLPRQKWKVSWAAAAAMCHRRSGTKHPTTQKQQAKKDRPTPI